MAKEHMAQIVILPLIPILRRHLAPIMSVIARSIVDQDLRWPKGFSQLGKGGFQRGDIAQITRCKAMRALQLGQKRLRSGDVHVNKTNLGALLGKGSDDLSTDARCAAGYKHSFAAQAGVIGKFFAHLGLFPVLVWGEHVFLPPDMQSLPAGQSFILQPVRKAVARHPITG